MLRLMSFWATSLQEELVLGGDGAAGVVDVFGSAQGHCVATQVAADVVDGVGVDLHYCAAQHGARVGDTVFAGDVEACAAHEATAGGEITRFGCQVHMGHQSQGLTAIGQGDGFLLQPHDVAGEAGHLLSTQGDTGAQFERLGVGDTGVHQSAVLLVVAGD